MEDTTQLEKMLSEHFAACLTEPGSLSEMEQVARARLLEVGRGAFERWLNAEASKEGVRQEPCECGGEAAYVRQRDAALRTVLGKVRYQRAYYLCPACGHGRCLLDEHYPHAIQIVDWFHACEYLDPVAKVAFRDQARQKTWLQQTKTALWEGHLEEVIAACQEHVDLNREEDPAQKVVTCYTDNRHRMDYPTYRANGYHIDSGTIESGIRQTGTQRVKVPGALI